MEPFFDEFSKNPLAKLVITKNGGHAAFTRNFGEAWFTNTIKDFIETALRANR
jgi:predicted alpha/beta-fold hydrolase